MFWNEARGLRSVPTSSKVALTVLLCVAGIGYLMGFANIYVSYSPTDQQPGLSVADIRLSFYGSRGATRLEKSVGGSMRQYLASETDYATVTTWLRGGAGRGDFETVVKPIFDVSCTLCHSAEARIADVVTASYDDVVPLLAQDTGKPVSRLIGLSHTHLLATLPVIFILCLIFSFTRFGEKVKVPVMAFSTLAILFDVSSWWLAKLSGVLAPLVLLGGISLALSFAALILLSLYDLWLARRAPL